MGSAVLDNVRSLYTIVAVLPVHYWLRWTSLFQGGAAGSLSAWPCRPPRPAVVMAAAYTILARRDPAA